jgi:LysR family glycine cleavage system transcriptional activator
VIFTRPRRQARRAAAPLPQAVGNEFAFYLVWRGDNPKRHRIHALRDWLTAEAAREQS